MANTYINYADKWAGETEAEYRSRKALQAAVNHTFTDFRGVMSLRRFTEYQGYCDAASRLETELELQGYRITKIPKPRSS